MIKILSLYRLTLGQARQEELLEYIFSECDDIDELKQACSVLARYYRMTGNDAAFMKYALKVTALDGCSEMCYEIGEYYFAKKDYNEAGIWFYNAVNETQALLSLACKEQDAVKRLEECKKSE